MSSSLPLRMRTINPLCRYIYSITRCAENAISQSRQIGLHIDHKGEYVHAYVSLLERVADGVTSQLTL